MKLHWKIVITGFSLISLGITPASAHHAIYKKKHNVRIHTVVSQHNVKISKSARVRHALGIHYSQLIPLIRGRTQLINQLNYLVSASNLTANIGIYVKSMRYGDQLFARNIYHSMIPASTIKILTAGAALAFLKPDYKFATYLLTNGHKIKDHELQGNLYVVLNGDPTLTYTDLVDLLSTLKTRGIQSIAGNFYIDNFAYDQVFFGPGWEDSDRHYCYGAPISASIINHNCLPFKIMPSPIAGTLARIEKSPNFFYPPIHNYLISKSRAQGCNIQFSHDLTNGLEIDGCVRAGKPAIGLSYVIVDVAEYNRALFKAILMQLNIQLKGEVLFSPAPYHHAVFATHYSKTLAELVKDMLKKSDNIIAETLLKKLGQLYTQRPGSWENGSFAINQILTRHGKINTAGLKMLDGSGLSAFNLATATHMMQLLEFVYHNQKIAFPFINALPIAGLDGTLKRRLRNIAHKMRAKTGTISGVISLAGYVTSADNDSLAFVILINGNKNMMWRYRELEDKISTALTRYVR